MHQVKFSQVESCKSKQEQKAEREKVELEKLLVDERIEGRRRMLVNLETFYLVLCQIVDALMVVEIIGAFVFNDVAGISMFGDMVEQGQAEHDRILNDPASCSENGGSETCTKIQAMTCPYWKWCPEDLILKEYPICGELCRIGDDVRRPMLTNHREV